MKKRKSPKNMQSNSSSSSNSNFLLLFITGLILLIGLIIVFGNQYFKAYNNIIQIFSYLGIAVITFLVVLQLVNKKFNNKQMFITKLVLLFFIIVIYLLAFRGDHLESGDDVVYLMNAQSFIQEGMLKILNLPSKPYSVSLHNFGLSILFAPLIALFGMNIIILQIEVLLLTIGFLLLFYLVLKEYCKEEIAILLMTAVGLHHHTVQFSYQLMSENPYLFFVFLSFYLWKKIKNNSLDKDKRSTIKLISFNLLLFFTTLIRKAGFLYIGAHPLLQLIKKYCQLFNIHRIVLKLSIGLAVIIDSLIFFKFKKMNYLRK